MACILVVKSAPERGRRPSPRKLGDGRPSNTMAQAGSSSVQDGFAKKTVAVVDDDQDIAKLLAMYLRRSGYQVYTVAYNGRQLIQEIASSRKAPDVILMDYRMPEMNGLDAADQIRKLFPDTRIVIVTGYDEIRERALVNGLAFLHKPFSLADLEHVLTQGISP
jgi:CheY-like chemotaxis protein